MKKTILIIEDNRELRENTAEILELEGYDVLTEVNGMTGFQQTIKSKPDVIICDVMMPVTDGLEFLKLVKADKTTADIPLIFFSADSAPPSVRKKLEQGADVYLRKPFIEEDLLAAVDNCLIDKK